MWNEQHVALLREQWPAGTPVAVIAAKVCKTRNAVIGKADRLGLGPHPNVRGPRRAPRERERKPRQPRPPKPRQTVNRGRFIFPGAPRRTKSEIYAMLREAVQNTIAA
jgi:hypothetical protein